MPEFTFEGKAVPAQPGATIGAALWAAGIREWRRSRITGRPRAMFCGIGQCFDCLVRVNGGRPVRACVMVAQDGADVRRGDVDDD